MFPSQNSTGSSPCQKPFHKLRIIFCFPDGSPHSQMHFSPFLHLYLDSLTHPALQLLCLCWGLWGSGGSGGGSWPGLLRWKQTSCLGTHKNPSPFVCVCSATRSKGHDVFRHTQRCPLHSSSSPQQSVRYLGKVIICSDVCLRGSLSSQLLVLNQTKQKAKTCICAFTYVLLRFSYKSGFNLGFDW